MRQLQAPSSAPSTSAASSSQSADTAREDMPTQSVSTSERARATGTVRMKNVSSGKREFMIDCYGGGGVPVSFSL